MMQLRRFMRSVSSSQLLESEVTLLANNFERDQLLSEVSTYLTEAGCDKRSSCQRPLAIEVDGPSHFYVNSTKYTAYTKLKHRILTKMGYQVLHIPYFEWNKLTTSQDKEQYVMEKLKTVPNERALD